MTKLEEIKEILHQKNASLVVSYSNGEIKEYYKNNLSDFNDRSEIVINTVKVIRKFK